MGIVGSGVRLSADATSYLNLVAAAAAAIKHNAVLRLAGVFGRVGDYELRNAFERD